MPLKTLRFGSGSDERIYSVSVVDSVKFDVLVRLGVNDHSVYST